MKAMCIENDITKCDSRDLARALSSSINIQCFDELSIGEGYDVLAIEQRQDDVWLYLDVDGLPYPSPYPAELFRLSDPSIPEGWSVSIKVRDGVPYIYRLSFSAWADDDEFYEKLINDDDAALAALKRQTESH